MNKEKIKDRKKLYRELNRDKIAQIIKCECGSHVRKDGLSNHMRTKTHINFIQSQEQEQQT